MDFQASSSVFQPGSDVGPTIAPRPSRGVDTQIGLVLDISGSSSRILLDAAAIQSLASQSDPSLSGAGQVGGQIKVKVGTSWLVANIRTLSKHPDTAGKVIAMIDFLGEGETAARIRTACAAHTGIGSTSDIGSQIAAAVAG